MRILLIISFAAVVAANYKPMYPDELWEDWKVKHAKMYSANDDEAIRRYIWEKNYKFVDKHNYEFSVGLHTYRVGMNQYADLDTFEFQKMFLRPFKRNAVSCKKSTTVRSKYFFLPDTVDWRTKGVVTPVKNQGQCGSCWAFSTTGSVEAAHAQKTGNLVSLSEQNLMDCSKPEGDFSCEGGLMDYAFEYIIENKGIDTEKSYPYEARDDRKCHYNTTNVGATISSCVDVESGSESGLQSSVGTVGPVSVAIDASHQSFQLYVSGVYSETDCSSVMLDHGVLAVGYGNDGSGGDYWLVKNSWGADWGMKGYIKMSRNNNNNCGIATSASYPVV